MLNKKICGLKLPEEINTYIRETAEREGRSLANVVSRMVIDSYNREHENTELWVKVTGGD